jgi:predicted enzyme related to lactoylglutathione lyase
MVTVNSFPQGTPIWVDLQSTNAAEAAAFYRALLGWDISEPTERSGGYRFASIGGVPVCAIGNLPPALAEKGAIPTWTTYLSVEDADAAATAIPEVGGTVLLPPGELNTGVRLLMATDVTGAVVGLWQDAGAHASWLRHEPGAVDWFELLSDDVDGAVGFYESVLGASVTQMKLGESDYQMLTSAGGEFAGVAASDVAGLPSHWRVYFAVTDLTDRVKLVKKLGGRVLMKPVSAAGVGSWAAVADPQGAVFSLLQAEQGTEAES